MSDSLAVPKGQLDSVTQPATINEAFFTEIIKSNKGTYLPLLQFFYSSTLKKVQREREIQGKKYPYEEAILVHLPTERRQCPKCLSVIDDPNYEQCEGRLKICPTCKIVKDDPKFNECEGTEKTRHDVIRTRQVEKHKLTETKWLDWKPFLNSKGFNQVVSIIDANLTETFSTSKINAKNFDIAKYAYGFGVSTSRDILKHYKDWQTEGIYVTKETREKIILTVAATIMITFNRSEGAEMLNRVSPQVKVNENPNGSDGLSDRLGKFFSI